MEAKKRRAATVKQNQSSVPEIFLGRERGEACEKAAKIVGANSHYRTDTKKIEQDAPEVLDQVKQGKLSIPQAKQVAVLPVEQRPIMTLLFA